MPAWKDENAQVLAFTLGETERDEVPLHVMLNMSTESRDFELPVMDRRSWYRAVDTSLISPQDIVVPEEQADLHSSIYTLASRSVGVLEAV